MNSITESKKLNDTVIKGGYCIGCGICATVKNSPFEIKFDNYSKLQAKVDENRVIEADAKVLNLCPFSNESKNEDEIGEELFGKTNIKHDKLGYIDSTFAGYVNEHEFRDKGSSGGMGSWILSELLNSNLVDGIIHVKPSEGNVLFKYTISHTIEEVSEGSSSRYYPIEMAEVIGLIRENSGRYAIVGLPCFIKSIRLLASQDTVINERIKFCVGLVCGHLKSAHFASMWGWQQGVHPDKLENINFRQKLDNNNASKYAVKISSEDKDIISPPVSELYGANWGWGFFKYQACDYCDDVVGETADISIGDAWLPEYVSDSKGTNVVVIRNKMISNLIQKARIDKRLHFDEITAEKVVQSQSSGFNHRREGLAYRLHLKDKNDEWRPNKRVQPSSNHLSKKLQLRQELRMDLANQSHIAFQEALKIGEFSEFKKKMDPIVKDYEETYKITLVRKVVNHVKKILNQI
ncbi:Coenzyme F420 hydrogenase/dehydrogenase, beta subunit C-terminal domain [Cytophaga sp. FL35]|uniref:Coenzyme F420 hydrogenase/dehydrogenase, beta subunit C-terminal domain n=1 Tax=Cytophaga sp. FL35 TaxID=1904456 RepID=UPI001653BB3E|nr:Coenzyme F420 hydrogenase/dehydrogenase, beta subunit C-terminal domain [Cytophaga sp. FL35]MBC6999401.1 Coenzyme F420 hydrogenase/dehydrogenase, beta subunit C-terminal domain [Cytophaga sp. FL35]